MPGHLSMLPPLGEEKRMNQSAVQLQVSSRPSLVDTEERRKKKGKQGRRWWSFIIEGLRTATAVVLGAILRG